MGCFIIEGLINDLGQYGRQINTWVCNNHWGYKDTGQKYLSHERANLNFKLRDKRLGIHLRFK